MTDFKQYLLDEFVFEKIIYPNTDHAFFNDTGTRYNAEAAHDAWAKMLAWFDRYLRLA